MDSILCKRVSTISFWNLYARWYRLWFEHTRYHDRIIKTLTEMVRPGWKVLDIGAGNGVLCWPLCAIGCEVKAIEPSIGMRGLLYEEGFRRGIDWIDVDERRWEDFSWLSDERYDLILACNSLHLTEIGFEEALEKVFRMRPQNVFVVTEKSPEIKIRWGYEGYRMLFCRFYSTDTSFAYHSLDELFEHYAFKMGRLPMPHEIKDVKKNLLYEAGHYWIEDTAVVGMYWWKRIA
ncbi:MAG: class I SAM-dependent methyltransferase [Nitrospirae bacterium]|nr:class I SAM-dependent methyltransferase [Nitrospirota bacterium]